MLEVKVNIPDNQVSNVLDKVAESGLCNLVHRRDCKTYIRDPRDDKFKTVEEEEVTFLIDSSNENAADILTSLIETIASATDDKFLELSVNSYVEDNETKRLLTNQMSHEEIDTILGTMHKI